MDQEEVLTKRRSLLYDFILPIALLASVGFVAWAIRGTRGFGAIPGCIYAGTCFAIIWFFLSKDNLEKESDNFRRYGLGWVVLGMILGIGINGMHGWMQYQVWRQGIFPIDEYSTTTVPLDPIVGYIWWFFAAVPWAGTGAIFIAWAGAKQKYPLKDWILRISLGIIGVVAAYIIFFTFPQILPNYHLGLYDDLSSCYGCSEAMGDISQALAFMGAYLGFLSFEIIKKDWMNVKLILIVGLTTAFWWIFFQAINIQQYSWRYFEAFAGAGIGIAFGLAFYICNKEKLLPERHKKRYRNIEIILGVIVALIIGIGNSIYRAFRGIIWNLSGIEPIGLTLEVLIPILLVGIGLFIISSLMIQKKPFEPGDKRDYMKFYNPIFIFAYVILRIIAILVTISDSEHPELSNWALIYLILAFFDAIIIILILRYKKISKAERINDE